MQQRNTTPTRQHGACCYSHCLCCCSHLTHISNNKRFPDSQLIGCIAKLSEEFAGMVVLKLVSNTRSVAAVRPRVATWPKNRGMVMRWIYCVLVLLGVVTGNGHAAGDNDLSYDEELYFRQLNKDHVLSVFNFALELTTGDDGKSALNHGNGFPRPYANLALSNKVQELDLSITAGRWQTPKWGSPEPRLHFPYGARVSAKFAERDLEGTLESTWSGLISELAGLFCASLSEMRLEEALVSRKRGADGSNFVVVESVLSRERVCTENLTPFTKLMPCRNKAGLGQLANPRTLFGGPYHGISVQVRRHSSQDDEPGTKFIVDQTVAAVLFAEDSNPNSESTQREVALAPLLGMTEEFRSCPVATSSTLIRHHSWGDSNSHGSLVEETPMASVHTNTLRASRSSHDIRQNLVHNLQLHRFASPRSKERGTISTRVLNADPSQSVVINYREQFPWNIKVYMHTCKVLLNGEAVDLTVNSSSVSLISGGDGSQSGWPFVSKGRAPAVVQLTNVSLRPGGTLFFSIEYEARFLNVDDFPPDPNYGFDMPPAEVEIISLDGKATSIEADLVSKSKIVHAVTRPPSSADPIRIFSEGVLLDFPLPDFSMPFNVLCLSATVVAMSFSAIFRTIGPIPLAPTPTDAVTSDK